MALSHKNVVARWLNGKAGRGFNMGTDGTNLYSYAMLIGRTLKDGTKQVLAVNGANSYSVSTSKHVILAMWTLNAYPREIIHPEIVRQGYGVWMYFPRSKETLVVRAVNQWWKTHRGAENALAKSGHAKAWYVFEKAGLFTLVFNQTLDESGHLVVEQNTE